MYFTCAQRKFKKSIFPIVLAYFQPIFACFSQFWLKMTSFCTKMSHSAAGKNQNGPKIVIQTCFIGIYQLCSIKVAYHIQFRNKNKGGRFAPPPHSWRYSKQPTLGRIKYQHDGASTSIWPFLDFPQMGESKNEIAYFAFCLIT